MLPEVAAPLEVEALPEASREVLPEVPADVTSEVAVPLEVEALPELPPEVLPAVPVAPEIAVPLEVEALPEASREVLSEVPPEVTSEVAVPLEVEALPELPPEVLPEVSALLETEALPDVSPAVQSEVLPEVAAPPEIAVPFEVEVPPEASLEVLSAVLPEVAAPLEVEAPPEASLEVLSEVPSEVLPEVDVPIEVHLSDALDGIAAASAETVGVLQDGQSQPGVEDVRVVDIGEHVAALGSATREARPEFLAAAELGRQHVSQGDLRAGVEWLERAAEASPTSQEEGFAVLYDLALALDGLGETARALAVLIDLDLDLDSGGYRDVRARIDRLMDAPAGSPGQ